MGAGAPNMLKLSRLIVTRSATNRFGSTPQNAGSDRSRNCAVDQMEGFHLLLIAVEEGYHRRGE